MALPTAQELTEYVSFVNIATPMHTSGYGTQTTTFATAWAKITEVGGMMDTETQQIVRSIADFEVVVPYFDGITVLMEINWGSRKLKIAAPPQKILDRYNRPWSIIRAQEITEHSV